MMQKESKIKKDLVEGLTKEETLEREEASMTIPNTVLLKVNMIKGGIVNLGPNKREVHTKEVMKEDIDPGLDPVNATIER